MLNTEARHGATSSEPYTQTPACTDPAPIQYEMIAVPPADYVAKPPATSHKVPQTTRYVVLVSGGGMRERGGQEVGYR